MVAKLVESSRRDGLKVLAAGAATVLLGSQPKPAAAQTTAPVAMPAVDRPILMDGHVHITNRVYWEGIDPWQPQSVGWDYARASAAGVNVIIEDVAPYGYWNYSYTAKQAFRLIETFHRVAEAHADKMEIALTSADARRIVASGRLATFMGIESGFDNEGDIDILRAMYRLGLRVVQFSSQTSVNAYADSALGGPPHWGGINDLGRALIGEMNRLGILIDITHSTPAAQAQIIAESRAPVVDSHHAAGAITGTAGLSDDLLRALAAKGGVIGIHGGAATVGKRYREWLKNNSEKAEERGRASNAMVDYKTTLTRGAADYGDFIHKMDAEIRALHMAAYAPWQDDPEAAKLVPTPDEWAEHVAYVIKTVGPDHVGIGLDMGSGKSRVPNDASGYPDLIAALNRITTPDNVRKITGENWLRVLDQAKVA